MHKDLAIAACLRLGRNGVVDQLAGLVADFGDGRGGRVVQRETTVGHAFNLLRRCRADAEDVCDGVSCEECFV